MSDTGYTAGRIYLASMQVVVLLLIIVSGCDLAAPPRGAYPKGEYLSYDTLMTRLDSLVAEHAILSKEKMTTSQGDVVHTAEGRALYVFTIHTGDTADKAELLLISGVHAREWVPVSMLYYFMELIIQQYGAGQADMRALVDNSVLYLVPMVNPDGYIYSGESSDTRYWRKNRRDNGDGTFGVDLNRNWGYQWGSSNDGYTSSTPISYQYRGPQAFSEPETQALKALMEKMDDGPELFIDYHSAAQMILHPWSYRDTPLEGAEGARLQRVAQDMAAATTARHGRPHAAGTSPALLYIASGTSRDYVYASYKELSFLVETRLPGESTPGFIAGFEKFSPPASSIYPTVEENFAGLLVAWKALLED